MKTDRQTDRQRERDECGLLSSSGFRIWSVRVTSLFNGQVYDLKWHPTANVFYKVIYDHEEKKEDTLKIAGMASRMADCS